LAEKAKKILEPRLAVRRLDFMLERRVEFSLLTYAFEDGGPTLVQLTEVSEPLLQRAQLGVIERPRSPPSGNVRRMARSLRRRATR